MNTRTWIVGVALVASLPAVAAPTGRATRFVELAVGNEFWQPGHRYRSGGEWLALTCAGSTCAFEPASLSVRREQWQGHYDERPTDGQKLAFKAGRGGPGTVVAWFRVDRNVPWLVPGPVTSYASVVGGTRHPPTDGTLEVSVDLPGGGEARFVPLYDRDNKKFMLQLRAQGRRQLLGELAPCSHEVNTGYLLWAGDLDRDGRPDYLVNFVDAEGQVQMLLSSRAKPGALVDVGGAFDASPFGGECDGMGWLEP